MLGPPVRFFLTCALMWIIAGSKKASVFPEPVAEMPTMSLPSSAIGQPYNQGSKTSSKAQSKVGQGVSGCVAGGDTNTKIVTSICFFNRPSVVGG